MTGQYSTIGTKGLSGNPLIDNLTYGNWINGDSTIWTNGISYSFPTQRSEYETLYSSVYAPDGTYFVAPDATPSYFTDAEIALIKGVLTVNDGNPYNDGFSLNGFLSLPMYQATGVDISEATIRLSMADLTSMHAVGMSMPPSLHTLSGDVFLTNNGNVNYRQDFTTLPLGLLMHELGHAMGLKHFRGTSGIGHEELDMTDVTLYGESQMACPGGLQTWGALDIQALQYLYGANYNTNSGNTVYSWNPNNINTYVNGGLAVQGNPSVMHLLRVALWDGGGIDTYDLSNYTTNVSINLLEGGKSDFGVAYQQKDVRWHGPNSSITWNVQNAYMVDGNTSSLIENAKGGSGNDTIIGNALDNVLIGHKGNDDLRGDSGNDDVYGGKGRDTLWGQDGADTFHFSASTQKDTIMDFTHGDKISLEHTGYSTWESIAAHVHQVNNDVHLDIGKSVIILHDFTLSDLNGDDFSFIL